MLERYKMIDSGIEWIGAIPQNWSVFPAGGVFSEVKEKNTNNEYSNAFSFRYGEIVDKKTNGVEDESVEETLSAYRVVSPDTIMINGLNLNYDFITQRVAIVKEKGIITSAYLAVQPDEDRIVPKFALYLFKAYDAKQVFHGMGSGVRKTLKYSDFKNIKIVAPSMDMQRHIVAYLDCKTQEIDQLIAEAKASIEEYKAWKASIVYEAVTKGLDPNVEMKDSGVEWIGDIPDTWSLRKIKNIASTGSGGTPKSDVREYYDGGINWVCSLDLHEQSISETKNTLSELGLQNCASEIRPIGTVVMAMYGGSGTIGNSGILRNPCATNQAICCIMFGDKIIPDYGFYYIRAIRPYWMIYAVGTRKDPNISQAVVSEMPMVVPSLEEQESIIRHLDKTVGAIDCLIEEKETLVVELESYKKSLVFEVVTGKRKV